jgi:hypothetical protein
MQEKKLITLIKSALSHDHLYTKDEVVYMKQQLKQLQSNNTQKIKLAKKGFGKL